MRKYSKISLCIIRGDRKELKEILCKGIRSVRTTKRAQILLAVNNQYATVSSISKIIGISSKTVYNTVDAYRKNGLNFALYDLPRQGKPSALSEKQDSQIVALACSAPPPGRTRWTVQLLVNAARKTQIVLQIGRETIRKLMKTHALKPWREKMWCVAKLDKEYISKMEDVLTVYEKPYDKNNPVVCMDEKPVQLLSEPYDVIPAKDNQLQRRDHEYKREGVANVFCAVEPKTGKIVVKPTPNRKAYAFAKFIRQLLAKFPKAKKVHLVMDNLNTHCEKSVIGRYGNKVGKALWRRIIVHHTPKHASWLNQAEIAIGIYSRQCLGRERINNLPMLENKTKLWKKNGGKIKIDWRFTRKIARKKFKY